MQLILLVLIAGLVGFWLSRSRFHTSIDQTAGKISESSRQAADRAGGWFRGLFSRTKPSQDVVDAEFTQVEAQGATVEASSEAEPIKSAEKTASRRKREEATGQE